MYIKTKNRTTSPNRLCLIKNTLINNEINFTNLIILLRCKHDSFGGLNAAILKLNATLVVAYTKTKNSANSSLNKIYTDEDD